jgi:hypothetical protein
VFDVTQNPFVYGEVVPASAFVDRVAELDRLLQKDLRLAIQVDVTATPRHDNGAQIADGVGLLGVVERRAPQVQKFAGQGPDPEQALIPDASGDEDPQTQGDQSAEP